MKNKHLFVPFDIALLAKKAGFKESCFSFWINFYPKTIPYLEETEDAIDYFESKELDDWGIPAPLFCQIIDWFREKHKLHIEVHHWTNQPVGNEIWNDCYQNFINGDALDVSIFKTYYQSLNKAIEEAFKLI